LAPQRTKKFISTYFTWRQHEKNIPELLSNLARMRDRIALGPEELQLPSAGLMQGKLELEEHSPGLNQPNVLVYRLQLHREPPFPSLRFTTPFQTACSSCYQ
jgi:hypothetical protein